MREALPEIIADMVTCGVCGTPRAGIMSWRKTGTGDAYVVKYRCRSCKNISTFVKYIEGEGERES